MNVRGFLTLVLIPRERERDHQSHTLKVLHFMERERCKRHLVPISQVGKWKLEAENSRGTSEKVGAGRGEGQARGSEEPPGFFRKHQRETAVTQALKAGAGDLTEFPELSSQHQLLHHLLWQL